MAYLEAFYAINLSITLAQTFMCVCTKPQLPISQTLSIVTINPTSSFSYPPTRCRCCCRPA